MQWWTPVKEILYKHTHYLIWWHHNSMQNIYHENLFYQYTILCVNKRFGWYQRGWYTIFFEDFPKQPCILGHILEFIFESRWLSLSRGDPWPHELLPQLVDELGVDVVMGVEVPLHPARLPMSIVPFFKNTPLSRQFPHKLDVLCRQIIVKAKQDQNDQ